VKPKQPECVLIDYGGTLVEEVSYDPRAGNEWLLHVLRYELEKHGLVEHLQLVMVSAEYAVRKPNVLLFDTAAAKLGMKPQDIWFIGDRWEIDIAGGKAAGMTPVWFHAPRGEYLDQVLSVRDWPDLLRHL
jgi:FMN phosphatase YigB (HAD superfamily)